METTAAKQQFCTLLSGIKTQFVQEFVCWLDYQVAFYKVSGNMPLALDVVNKAPPGSITFLPSGDSSVPHVKTEPGQLMAPSSSKSPRPTAGSKRSAEQLARVQQNLLIQQQRQFNMAKKRKIEGPRPPVVGGRPPRVPAPRQVHPGLEGMPQAHGMPGPRMRMPAPVRMSIGASSVPMSMAGVSMPPSHPTTEVRPRMTPPSPQSATTVPKQPTMFPMSQSSVTTPEPNNAIAVSDSDALPASTPVSAPSSLGTAVNPPTEDIPLSKAIESLCSDDSKEDQLQSDSEPATLKTDSAKELFPDKDSNGQEKNMEKKKKESLKSHLSPVVSLERLILPLSSGTSTKTSESVADMLSKNSNSLSSSQEDKDLAFLDDILAQGDSGSASDQAKFNEVARSIEDQLSSISAEILNATPEKCPPSKEVNPTSAPPPPIPMSRPVLSPSPGKNLKTQLTNYLTGKMQPSPQMGHPQSPQDTRVGMIHQGPLSPASIQYSALSPRGLPPSPQAGPRSPSPLLIQQLARSTPSPFGTHPQQLPSMATLAGQLKTRTPGASPTPSSKGLDPAVNAFFPPSSLGMPAGFGMSSSQSLTPTKADAKWPTGAPLPSSLSQGFPFRSPTTSRPPAWEVTGQITPTKSHPGGMSLPPGAVRGPPFPMHGAPGPRLPQPPSPGLMPHHISPLPFPRPATSPSQRKPDSPGNLGNIVLTNSRAFPVSTGAPSKPPGVSPSPAASSSAKKAVAPSKKEDVSENLQINYYNSRTFVCKICGAEFGRKWTFDRHLKSVHSALTSPGGMDGSVF